MRNNRSDLMVTERLRFETLVMYLSDVFIRFSPTMFESQVETAIRLIVEFLGMDSGLLVLFGKDPVSVPAVSIYTVPDLELPGGADLDGSLRWYAKAAGAGRPVIVSGIPEDLPEEAIEEWECYERAGIRCRLIVPIKLHENLLGTCVFLSVRDIGLLPDETVGKLTLLGEILAHVLGRMRAEEQNTKLLSFEKLLSTISTKLINLPGSEIDGEIQRGLQAVVNFLDVDRGAVFQFSTDMSRMNRTHSWTEEGIVSSPDNYETVALPWTAERLQKKESVVFEKTDDLPVEADIDRAALLNYGIKSAVMVPMIAGGRVLGSVSVSTIRREIVWPRRLVDRLRVIGDIFASALARKRTEELLQEALEEVTSLKEKLEAENIYLRKEINVEYQDQKIVGQSEGLKHAFFRASQAALSDATVLVLGETGTGKELMAVAIHNMSPRRDRALITVNCAALPSDLIESELFGHEKGAFTGADARQLGRFEIAHNSTLCLDEIGELPLMLQAKLLRVLQNGEFQRLGSAQNHKVDVRIIATTNRNLEEEVRKGRFRQDLFYRINVFPVLIPPLRERKEDIPLLVETFVHKYGRKLGKKITSVAKDTMKALLEYSWPGNVRELESVIERSVILCPGTVLRLTDKLNVSTRKPAGAKPTLQDVEREHIIEVLSESRWRVEGASGAAEKLGLHPSTLRSRMRKLGIR
ncbi:MAG: sigma 54-interacting transcriptional regulator [Thermodesulfobacteriota bacterium]